MGMREVVGGGKGGETRSAENQKGKSQYIIVVIRSSPETGGNKKAGGAQKRELPQYLERRKNQERRIRKGKFLSVRT